MNLSICNTIVVFIEVAVKEKNELWLLAKLLDFLIKLKKENLRIPQLEIFTNSKILYSVLIKNSPYTTHRTSQEIVINIHTIIKKLDTILNVNFIDSNKLKEKKSKLKIR